MSTKNLLGITVGVLAVVAAIVVAIIIFRPEVPDSVPVSTNFEPNPASWNELKVGGWVELSAPGASSDGDTVILTFDKPELVAGTPPTQTEPMKAGDTRGEFSFALNAPGGGKLTVTATYHSGSKAGPIEIKKKTEPD